MEQAAETGRRQALDAILASQTFRRADLLKKLLTYLVEQVEQDCGSAISEHEIANQVLGRGTGFSPDTDSSVRTRMHALRQKLDEYYREEGVAAVGRITIPKGGYAPQFEPVETALPTIAPVIPTAPPLSAHRRWPVALLTLAASLLCLWMAIALGYLSTGPRWRLNQDVRELWNPFLSSVRKTVISVGQPAAHLWVRDYGPNPLPLTYPPFPDPPPKSAAFLRFYQERSHLLPDSNLVLHPSPNATLWGDSAGATVAGKFLSASDASSELLPEATVNSEVAIRDRPIIVFGRPEFSPLANRYLTAANGYQVGYLSSIRKHAIWSIADPSKYFLNAESVNQVNLGLVTIFRSNQPPVMVLNGITSDGSLGGIEYLTNPASVADLRERFRKEGYADWPSIFQVIVETTSSGGYPIRVAHQAHLVLKR